MSRLWRTFWQSVMLQQSTVFVWPWIRSRKNPFQFIFRMAWFIVSSRTMMVCIFLILATLATILNPHLIIIVSSRLLQIFTRSQIVGADTARKLQAILGWPSVQDYRKYVAYNHIKNSPVTINDIDRAEYIYRPTIPILQGKITRTTPVTKTTSTTPVSPLILQHHQNIDLYCDFLFVNKLLFLHTKSKNINFLSIQSCKNRTSNTIINGLLYVK